VDNSQYHNLFNNVASDGASDNYISRRIMVAIIRLCSYKGELNIIASSKWLDVEISSTSTLSIMSYCY